MRCLLLGVVLAGCGTSNDVVGPFTGNTHRYTLDSIRLPMTNAETVEYGGNLDGSGPVDNVLGQTIASFVGGYGNLTPHAGDMIAAGAIASTVEIVADDLENDPSVGVRYLGTPSSPYVIIGGRLEDGAFTSNLTAHTNVAGEAELHLPVFAEADPSLLHAIGVEMFLEPDGSGGFEATIHAGIPHDTRFMQVVHRGIAQMVASDPGAHRTMLGMLDNNPRDGALSYQEIANNSLIMSFLAPDVTLGGRAVVSFGFRAHLRPCPSGSCTDDLPLDRCFDRVLDGDETDVDCGGSCRSCEAGARCETASDCETAACDGGVCGPPSCTNGVRDGLESDIDCGDACSMRCELGARCYLANDCITLQCGPCEPDGDGGCRERDWGAPADICSPSSP